jgi:hypothetical protein
VELWRHLLGDVQVGSQGQPLVPLVLLAPNVPVLL